MCKKRLPLFILGLAGVILILGYVFIGRYHQKFPSDSWNLTVVNRWNKLSDEYNVELKELSNGELVDIRIYPFLQEMFEDAREEGIYLIVRDGYRTEEEQQEILDNKIAAYVGEGYFKELAEKIAEVWVALPGMSEHHLGSAVDINADKEKSSNEEVYTWLANNAHEYGFILRYPEGKELLTWTSYEPWHYRYVGEEAAKEIYQDKLCLEEYVEKN